MLPTAEYMISVMICTHLRSSQLFWIYAGEMGSTYANTILCIHKWTYGKRHSSVVECTYRACSHECSCVVCNTVISSVLVCFHTRIFWCQNKQTNCIRKKRGGARGYSICCPKSEPGWLVGMCEICRLFFFDAISTR